MTTYASFGTEGSGVFVFTNSGGMLECCSCPLLTGSRSFEAGATIGMIAHLRAHVEAGHTVPASVTPAIVADSQVNFPLGTVPCPEHGRVSHEHECWRSR